MNTSVPCKFCGCSETNLVDGFYYCAECGTQDTNVRETVVELVVFNDGDMAISGRKSIKHAPKAEVEMPDDWYKWHTLNFLLRGLADEIIALGAQPSFKTKLLWVWTRYMDKYQNKADFGIATTEEEQNNEDEEEIAPNDKTSKYSDDEDDEEEESRQRLWMANKMDIKHISMPLVISMLYVALNLDKSHIQLGHLIQLMRLGKVSIIGWPKLIPEELRPKKLKRALFFKINRFIYSFDPIRVISVLLFRELDLGNPVVPDLRLLVDNYLKELCLPNDIKPLVISLLHARSFDYLDVNVQYPDIYKIPSYELYVMGHILMALKVCFGFDSKYEFALSDVVDKINELENYSKSNIYIKSKSERLFSFYDWCCYIRFRKAMLWTHTLELGAPNIRDMDDYVTLEHLVEKPDYKINLKDEITVNILKKIPNGEINVIPKSEFVWTLTPHSTFTKVIIDHIQDPEVKNFLGEDFTQYSLKYVTQDMFLVDLDSGNPKNILKGINKRNVIATNRTFLVRKPLLKTSRNYKSKVYVKDCDNHNWMTTLRPNLEHVTKGDESDEKENNHLNFKEKSLDSTNETLDKTKDNAMSATKNKSKVIQDIEMDDNEISLDNNINMETETKNDEKHCKDILFLPIREEDEETNIFDDDFRDLDIKKDKLEERTKDNEEPNFDNIVDVKDLRYDDYMNDDLDANSDVSSEDSLHLNPDSLNREEAIKELVLHACHKYKITVPGIYVTTRVKHRHRPLKPSNAPRLHHGLGEVKQKIQGFMAEYRNLLDNDPFHQIASKVQSAIADFNRSNEKTQEETDEAPIDDGLNCDQNVDNSHLDNMLQESMINDTIKDDEYKLFGDSSDGETQAEELLPKKNPEFNEETHDITQLYIKQDKNPGIPEMQLNPKLQRIVDRKIKDEIENPKSFDLIEKEKSDSEDELPLSLMIELKKLRKQQSEQNLLNSNLKRLIENSNIGSYQYWVKKYNSVNTTGKIAFFKIMEKSFPKSFSFVLRECADVVGYEPKILYNALQDIEQFLTKNNIYFGNSEKRPAPEFQKSLVNKKKRKIHT